jgi:hypothetical protein
VLPLEMLWCLNTSVIHGLFGDTFLHLLLEENFQE